MVQILCVHCSVLTNNNCFLNLYLEDWRQSFSPIRNVCRYSTYSTALYFVQKQKLEEIKLFKDLFAEFNCRYDRLNGKISDIKSKKITDSDQITKILDDYFNLCSEEYLFYKEGRIHNLVWGAWCRGIKEHLMDNIINAYWEKAQIENSYYGLTTEVIEEGTRIKT